jgi:large conductance mechanosensitive channel
MQILKEFRAFIDKGNVVDLAVAVVLGAAFTKIVNAVVEGLVMPIVSAALPGGDWASYTVTPLHLKVGLVVAAVVDFLVVAAVVFLVVVKMMGVFRKRAAAPATPSTKTCPECLETIPKAASRCRACTAPQGAVASAS